MAGTFFVQASGDRPQMRASEAQMCTSTEKLRARAACAQQAVAYELLADPPPTQGGATRARSRLAQCPPKTPLRLVMDNAIRKLLCMEGGNQLRKGKQHFSNNRSSRCAQDKPVTQPRTCAPGK